MTFPQICLYAAIILGGYLVGSVPFGYLIGRVYGHDIRREGSGNIGATNVTRVVGPNVGKLCFALDFLKGFLPVLMFGIGVAKGWFPTPAGGLGEAVLIVAVVAGHMFTIFLGFKGGKGIATALGAVTAVTPYAALTAFALWAAVFLATGYVSLGSIAGALALPFLAWGFSCWNLPRLAPSMLIFFAVLALFAVWKHRSNIRRLCSGTENRFSRKKRGES